MLVDILHALLAMISTVINFITHLPQYISQIVGYIAHLPTFLVATATAMIPVLIVNKLLHADNT